MGAPVASPPAALPSPAEPVTDAVRPLQLVLAVGAALVVSSGAAVAAGYGGPPARALLVVLAGVGALLSRQAARSGLRSSAETFAACAASLFLLGTRAGAVEGGALAPLMLAALFLAAHRWTPDLLAWPLAAWVAAQLGGLRAIDAVPPGERTALFLTVALVGLGTALLARPVVARIALATTGPWWLAGVGTGLTTAWTGAPAARWGAVVLMLGAAAGLVLARLRRELDPLTGPLRAVPVLAGCVPAAALAGALAALGAPGTAVAGYLGVLVASVAAAALDRWPRGLFLPSALAGGVVLVLLSVGRLTMDHAWVALSALLFLTSAPAVLVAFRRPEDRPVALPVAVGCLTGSVLLGLPGGFLTATGTAVGLTALYAVASLAGPDLEPEARRSTEATAAVAGVAAVLVLAAVREWGALAVDLAFLGVCTLGWAWRTSPGAPEMRRVWPAGAAQLVAAAWLGAVTAGWHVTEAFTLSLAAGLLLSAGPRLTSGPSWPTCGPALVVAAVPSTVLVVLQPVGPRPALVLLAAVVTMLSGARLGLRAPLMVGSTTALVVGLRLSLTALPWPVTTALALGALLLAEGVRRERFPVAAFGYRLADLR